jgi:predicted pyridoxine 5'-phosphate oxidase superfamily flavin-nucleotide-binding protein
MFRRSLDLMRIDRPFHEGELFVQRRVGEEAEARRSGRGIANAIVAGAFAFVEAQPLVVLGSVAPGGAAWASLVFGRPGFARVVDERALELDLAHAAVHPADPVLADLAVDPRVGLLFLEPETRRRLRVNGTVRRDDERLIVAVAESYPNCPKYIRRRRLEVVEPLAATSDGVASRGTALDEGAQALVSRADTFFVASSNPAGDVDVSHRGGEPGFVEIVDESTLSIPDYPGNHMFNTFGNLALEPRAGATFLDFETGRVLMATGTATIEFARTGQELATRGTNRSWRFRVEESRSFIVPVRLRSELLEP